MSAPPKLMTFTEHLEELRARLGWSLLALVIGAGVGYAFAEPLYLLLARPLIQAWKEAGLGTPQVNYADLLEPLMTELKVALLGGFFIAIPFVFYQLWMFISPGLRKEERRLVLPFTISSTVLFIGGALFAYFAVLPATFSFLLNYAHQNTSALQKLFGSSLSFGTGPLAIKPMLMMSDYFSLVWKLLAAFGLIFELPLLISFLALAGIVTHRSLWKWNPYFVVLAFVMGGALTPPDVFSQLLMALPMIALYNASIVLAWIFARRRAARSKA